MTDERLLSNAIASAPEAGNLQVAVSRLKHRRASVENVAWGIFLTALVVIPWLSPGYIFATDFAGPRHFPLPDGPASYAALQATLALMASFLPAEIVGKILIVAILLGASVGASAALPIRRFEARAVAALIYVFNPFVYDRLAYGQLTVLAGYALLPWFAAGVRKLLENPTSKNGLTAGLLFALLGIVDLHLALIAAATSMVLLISYLTIARPARDELSRIARTSVVGVAVAIAASSYWLIPLSVGIGGQARSLARLGPGDLTAFSTVDDPVFGTVVNVIGLFGFWGEDTGRFTLDKNFVPLWPAVICVFVAMAMIGIGVGWRDNIRVRHWTISMAILGAVAVVLGIGVASASVAPIVNFLDSVFPPYRGMRDAGKWGALLALAYSQLIPVTACALIDWAERHLPRGGRRELGVAALTALVIALPLYYGNGMLYGMHATIRPSEYPTGWYQADAMLLSDPNHARAVFLPFHGFMEFSFIRNQNAVVGSPAPSFFSIPVFASEDPEVSGVKPPLDDPDQALVAGLVSAGNETDWGVRLASRDFKYVLLARELDWKDYAFLDKQSHLALVRDYGSILIYRNLSWS